MSRVTIVTCLYHQADGMQAVEFEGRYNRTLSSDDAQYLRPVKIADWQPLDTAWIKQAGVVAVRNDEMRDLQRIPAPDELAEMQRRILQIGVALPQVSASKGDMWSRAKATPEITPIAKIRANELFYFDPVTEVQYFIRCLHGTARCTVFAVPE